MCRTLRYTITVNNIYRLVGIRRMAFDMRAVKINGSSTVDSRQYGKIK